MFDCDDTIPPALNDVIDQFSIERDDPGCRVVTPFEHHNGDLIRLWVEDLRGDMVVVRDHGETFAMLRLYGVNPHSDANKPRVQEAHQQFGLVHGYEGELAATASESELGTCILHVLQAIQACSRLMYTHSSRQPSYFKHTVYDFLDDVGYDYAERVPIQGENDEREFDIGINHRDPGVLLDTIHASDPSRLNPQVDRVMYNWHEIKNMEYNHGAVIDDEGGKYDEEKLDVLTKNLDYTFKWSEKERITQEIPVKA